jgi:hypothetical protein
VPLGLVLVPIIAPIFFGQKAIKVSIQDADFKEKLESFSSKHLQWAKLMKEHIKQQENDCTDFDVIIKRHLAAFVKERLTTPRLRTPSLLQLAIRNPKNQTHFSTHYSISLTTNGRNIKAN